MFTVPKAKTCYFTSLLTYFFIYWGGVNTRLLSN